MGEHHNNPNAQMKKMAPPMPARKLMAQVTCAFAPKEALLILPPDRIRTREDGVVEVFGKAAVQKEAGGPIEVSEERWHVPPEPCVVHPEGKPLTMDQMDFVVFLQGISVNTQLTDSNGQHPAKAIVLRELERIDANDYLARFDPPSSLVT